MSEFKVGDTVRLKSGGPIMAISEPGQGHDERPGFVCLWFDNTAARREGWFPEVLLIKAEPINQEALAKQIMTDIMGVTMGAMGPLLDPKGQS